MKITTFIFFRGFIYKTYIPYYRSTLSSPENIEWLVTSSSYQINFEYVN